MAHTVVIRPGTIVYEVNQREFLIEWSVSPRFSTLLRDDTPANSMQLFFRELSTKRQLDLDEWRQRLGAEPFGRLVAPLVQSDFLVDKNLVAPIGDGLGRGEPLTVGVVGSGIPLLMAIESISRHQHIVRAVRVYSDDGPWSDRVREIFPYCGEGALTLTSFAERLGIGDRTHQHSNLDSLDTVDLIVISLPRIVPSLLLDVEAATAESQTPWVHALASCTFGLSGPIGGGETGVGVVDFLENLKACGFLREGLPDPLIAPGTTDDVLATSVSVLCQVIPKAVAEGLRFICVRDSELRAAMHIVDGDRGLVARSRMTISRASPHRGFSVTDPAIAPPLTTESSTVDSASTQE